MTGTAVDLIWLAPALALLGFVANGALVFVRPTAKTLVSVIGAACCWRRSPCRSR